MSAMKANSAVLSQTVPWSTLSALAYLGRETKLGQNNQRQLN